MLMKKLMASWDGAKQVAMASTLIAVLLAAGNLLLIIKIASMHERIVITPPHVERRMEVNWRSADAEYLKSIGHYFSMLTGNVTVKSAPVVADIVSAIVAPEIYPEVRTQIMALAKDPAFASSSGTVRFDADRIVYEPLTNKVFVLGVVSTITSGGRTEARPRVYELQIRIAEGRPQIYAATNYEGKEARTQEWLKKNHTEEKEAEAE